MTCTLVISHLFGREQSKTAAEHNEPGPSLTSLTRRRRPSVNDGAWH